MSIQCDSRIFSHDDSLLRQSPITGFKLWRISFQISFHYFVLFPKRNFIELLTSFKSFFTTAAQISSGGPFLFYFGSLYCQYIFCLLHSCLTHTIVTVLFLRSVPVKHDIQINDILINNQLQCLSP